MSKGNISILLVSILSKNLLLAIHITKLKEDFTKLSSDNSIIISNIISYHSILSVYHVSNFIHFMLKHQDILIFTNDLMVLQLFIHLYKFKSLLNNCGKPFMVNAIFWYFKIACLVKT
nr:hypothetical protein CJLB15_00008 [Campylobacter phage CJLB-15]